MTDNNKYKEKIADTNKEKLIQKLNTI